MKAVILALALAPTAAFVGPSRHSVAASRMKAEEGSEEAAPAPAAPASPAPPVAMPSGNSGTGFSLSDLQSLAETQNPVVGYFDPISLSQTELWESNNEESIGFLRQAEIKHGRVAMAGFVGYLVHAQGITWGFPMQLDGTPWPKLDEVGSVPGLWDALPANSKWQIIAAIGCLEWYDEWQYDVPGSDMGINPEKPKHYMRGGTPGKYPKFDGYPFNLFDPFQLSKKMTEEQKARGRNAEINNGRLAMIGLFGLLSESVTPGSVPFLTQFNFPQYAGNVMIPFEGQFSLVG